MEKRASDARAKGLSAEEHRDTIIRSHRKGSGPPMYDAADDPYTYENSTVLINILGLRKQTELDAFEAEISSARAEEPLPDGSLDFTHFKAIHHHLFQDVYKWAGQVRTVRMSKGGNPFCFPENMLAG